VFRSSIIFGERYLFGSTLMARPRELRPPLVGDRVLVGATIALVVFGLVMIYSATGVLAEKDKGDPFFYLKRQAFSAAIGIPLMFALSFLNMSRVKELAGYLYPVCVVLLLLTVLPGVGLRAGGAQRWINLGFTAAQPGELVKLLFVVCIARFFSRHEHELHRFVVGVVRPAMLVGLLAGLFLWQPDFGSTAVLCAVMLAMSVAAGVSWKHLGAVIGGGVAAATLLVVTSSYRMSRVIHFLNPGADPRGKGYQLDQSLIALGSGDLFGVGLGASKQKLFFLPAAHTDFIFALIGEELGFVGCVAVLFVFLLFLWRGLLLARRLSSDIFAFTLAVGLTVMVTLPAFLNMGVVSGMLPTKGLVLPLIGYGGSSLVSSLASVGLLLGLARSRQRGLL
jgi:cell division protein FtsW